MTLNPSDVIEPFASDAKDIFLAAPYIKVNPLAQLLEMAGEGANVTCITRWTHNDIQIGASDLDCWELIAKFGGQFRLHQRMHAKYYRFDSNSLVGSANLTASGIGYAQHPNVEILCPPESKFDGSKFERSLMVQSRLVDREEYDRWSQLRNLAAMSGADSQDTDPFKEWVPITRDPENVWLAYIGRLDAIISPDEGVLAKQDLSHFDIPRGLQHEEFDAWIRIGLLSSAAFNDVMQTERMTDSDAWTWLGEKWETSKSDAQRLRETAQNWKARFLNNGTPP